MREVYKTNKNVQEEGLSMGNQKYLGLVFIEWPLNTQKFSLYM